MRSESDPPKLKLRAWILLFLSIVAAQVLWPTVRLQLSQHSLQLRAGASAYSGELVLQWRDPQGRPQGKWVFVDGWQQHSRELTIDIPASSPDQPTEFHLYEIQAGGQRLVPRVTSAAEATPSSAPSLTGNWTDADGGKGVFFRGPEAGSLRIQLPPTTAHPKLVTEATRTGGPVRTNFGGAVMDRNCRAAQWTLTTWTLDSEVDAPLQDIAIALPAYQVRELELCRTGAGRGTLDVESAVLRRSFAGLAWNSVSSLAPAEVEAGEQFQLNTTTPASLHVTMVLCRVLFTLALTTLGALLAPVVTRRTCRMPIPAPTGVRATFWLVLLLLVGVRVWLAISTPVFMLPDGVEYVINAERLLETGSFGHFDAWRQPGPSLYLAPFLAASSRGEVLACLAQAGGGVLTSVLVYRLLCPLVGSRWSTAAMLLTGLHPAALTWERFVLSESLAAILIVAWWWCLTRAIRPGSLRTAFSWGVSAGVIAGIACLVRSNAILLVGIGPAAIVFAGGQPSAPRRLGLAGLCAVLSLLPLLPPIVSNARRYDAAVPFVGSGFARCIFHWYAGAIDPNQSQVVSSDQARSLVQARTQHLSEFLVLHALRANSNATSQSSKRAEWTTLDRVAEHVAEESRAREPVKVLQVAGLAALSHVGLWRHPAHTSFDSTRDYYARLLCAEPVDGANHNWFRPAAAEEDAARNRLWRVGTSAVYEPHLLEAIERRTLDASWPDRAPLASRVLGWWWRAFSVILRPVLGSLFLLGCGVAWRERESTMLIAGAVFTLTAAALAWVLLCGEARYTDPLQPVLVSVACFGLARAVRSLRGRYLGAGGRQNSRLP